MSRLPRISGRECIAALGKAGFYVKLQEGSHVVLRRDEPFGQLVVPDHKELDRRPDDVNGDPSLRAHLALIAVGDR